jgi:hypothetical protein
MVGLEATMNTFFQELKMNLLSANQTSSPAKFQTTKPKKAQNLSQKIHAHAQVMGLISPEQQEASREKIMDAYNSLSELHRVMLLMHYGPDKLTYDEIGRAYELDEAWAEQQFLLAHQEIVANAYSEGQA